MKKIDKKELHNIFINMQSNNKLSFNELYEKYKDLVYSIAFSILRDKENSEDIVQNVYIKIWNMEKKQLPKCSEASWLYSLTKNETLDFIKYKKNLQNIDEIYYITEENNEINKIIDKDSYNRIISKLNNEEQEIISLKVLSNLSFNEISQLLNIPEGTVKWKYYKSIHTLKLLLGNLGMFITTFVVGLSTLFSSKKGESTKVENVIQSNEESIEDSTTTSEQQKHENYINDAQGNTINMLQESTTQQNTNQIHISTKNYYSFGILGISSIFLIFTIIFAIIFTKHQLKRKLKSSK